MSKLLLMKPSRVQLRAILRCPLNISKTSLLDHLDAYTAPRLVEYFDQNPCHREKYERRRLFGAADQVVAESATAINSQKSHGVTIEESFSAGEYDILILSAKESDGLEKWLTSNGYKIPDGATKTLGSYIKQDMKFFVAKVNTNWLKLP